MNKEQEINDLKKMLEDVQRTDKVSINGHDFLRIEKNVGKDQFTQALHNAAMNNIPFVIVPMLKN